MQKYKLGIVGASGLVGKTILTVLKEEGLLEIFDLYLIVSEKNADKEVCFNNKKYKYIKLTEDCLTLKLDVLFFSAGDDVSKIWAPRFAKLGCYVINNSNAFRKEKNVPLVVPEININQINKNTKIIANPNCSTIQLVLVLHQLLNCGEISDVIISSYQSVSGAGREAVEDLKNNTKNYFDIQIKDNIIAHIGKIGESGFCNEENKIMFETQKILQKNINIYATTVRVPVESCHGESVYLKFKNSVTKKLINKVLKCKFIKYSSKIYHNNYCKNKNETFVYRLRKPTKNEILFFVMADNLRRGAAYNAVLILKYLLKFI